MVVAEPAHRPDGRGYIDDEDALDNVTESGGGDDASDGSSVEEEDTDDERSHGGWPLEAGAEDAELVDELSDDEMLEWGVEDEDWELADGSESLPWCPLMATNPLQTSQSSTTACGSRTPRRTRLPARPTPCQRATHTPCARSARPRPQRAA